MNKINYLLVAILLFILIVPKVKADFSDDPRWDPYKEEAKNITVTYTQALDSEGNAIKGKYKLQISGVNENFRIKVFGRDEHYTSVNAIDGIITIDNIDSGITKVGVYHSQHISILLRTITVNIKKFNEYSQREECKGKEDLDVCKEDYEYELNESTFMYKINKYNEQHPIVTEEKKEKNNIFNKAFNKIINFLSSYFVYIIISIIIVTITTTLIIFRKKKYSLE